MPGRRYEGEAGDPIAYVALGSHANYFEPGTFRHSPRVLAAGCCETSCGLCGSETARARGGWSGRALVAVNAIHPSWMRFAGAWGESAYVHFPNNAPIAYGGAPRGPAFHDAWRRPVAEELGWPPG